MTRRDALMASLGLVAGGMGGAFIRGWLTVPAPKWSPLPSPNDVAHEHPSAEEALAKLVAGNKRFAEGRSSHPRDSPARRDELIAEQRPFAVILGCADSRVSPEVVFDEGLGDLFVVRQAGHVADDDSLGSIEYAVGHLHVPLVVVLGHEGCGAVTAAIGAVLRDEPVEGHVLRLVDDIAPAVTEAQGRQGDVVDFVVRANVRQVVNRLRACGPVLRPRARRGEVRIIGAYYDLHTGLVEWLQD